MNGCSSAVDQTASKFWNCRRWLGALVIGPLALACGTPPPAADSYRVMSSDEVAHLELSRLDSLVLKIPNGLIKGITHFRRHDGRYYLLDGYDKKVHVFDLDGSHLLSFGGEGSGPGEFRRPIRLAFDQDEILVIDPGQHALMATFGDDGSFRAAEQLPLPRGPTAFEVVGGSLYVLTPGVTDSSGGGWDQLTVLDSNFGVVGRGCPVEARVVESMKSNGSLSTYQPSGVAVLDELVYCVHPISPTIQVMNTDGKNLGAVAVAPPFYRAPLDGPFSTNQKEILKYAASFTSHNVVYPVRDGPGFVSVYRSYDLEAGGSRYWLFRCTLEADWGVRDCAMTESNKKVVLVTPEGDVFLEEEAEPNGPPVVGIYRLVEEKTER